ncbi:MAG: hypothetical protein ABIS50_15315 [Luteolibacter sp.]|uniref:hypothetical protein n=1 Tax=Luteolibacter sp. TaxID=1962973 RepID=UPI003264B041
MPHPDHYAAPPLPAPDIQRFRDQGGKVSAFAEFPVAVTAPEKPFAGCYIEQLEALIAGAVPVLEYHRSMEMSAFARGDGAAEKLHREFGTAITAIQRRLQINAGVARQLAGLPVVKPFINAGS